MESTPNVPGILLSKEIEVEPNFWKKENNQGRHDE
jgi:hypothetical protein